jgi:3-hydroxy-3-methylglutaryl CoA synthase
MFNDVYALENGEDNSNDHLKIIAKSEGYQALIAEKVEPTQRASSEIGNMYTASIFTALISALQVSYQANEKLEGQKIGFIGYGSGSKSKVFEGTVAPTWKSIIEKVNLFEYLEQRQPITFDQYENLHNKAIKQPIVLRKGFALEKIEKEIINLEGARYYTYKS